MFGQSGPRGSEKTMTSRSNRPKVIRTILGGLALIAVTGTSMPAMAQDSSGEARIRKLEAEVRALQRRVFPGGDGRFFEPQVSSAGSQGGTVSTPSTTAVTDILARLDALEAQLQALTAQTEINTNALTGLETRLAVLEDSGNVAAPDDSATDTNLSAMTGGASTSASTSTPAAPAGPTAERLAAVQQIAKPQTDDAGDDEYSYGYRLWNAGFYPEAQQQLTLFVEGYPNHWRTTYGRNLLGRAYLDDGKPREAAPWFLRNYQSDKQAARAGDSLLFLAEAMIASNDTDRACIALAEFGEAYPALATGRLSDRYEANRGKVTCN